MPKRSDPVLPDQGGRSMPIDPLNPVSPACEGLVRDEAYEIYQRRRSERGHTVDQWLEAERELTARQRRRRDSLLLKWTH